MNAKLKTHHKERAQSMVEMAISFTMVMFLLSGVVDLGRAFFALIAIRDAAQEGAVYASTHPLSVKHTEVRAVNSSSDPIDLLDESNVDVLVAWPDGQACAGTTGNHSYGITVTVRYKFEFMMPFMSTIIPDNMLVPGETNKIWLPASTTNTILYPPC